MSAHCSSFLTGAFIGLVLIITIYYLVIIINKMFKPKRDTLTNKGYNVHEFINDNDFDSNDSDGGDSD